jgi:hypothetical protein
MDTLLIIVTALSLAMASAMAVVVAKLLGDDRARSDARVAALRAMAADGSAPPVDYPRAPRTAPAVGASPTARAPQANPATTSFRRRPVLDDLEIRPADPAAVAGRRLFAEPEHPSAWRPRLAVIGVLAVVLAAIAVGLTFASAGGRAPVPASAMTSTATSAENAPLELLSLRHAQDGSTLTISGLVRNPPTGAAVSGVAATAFVFAADGTLLASSRALVDETPLAPGDESPFAVSVAVAGEVARYRIGFRAEEGRVIAHVDKRTPEALASSSQK